MKSFLIVILLGIAMQQTYAQQGLVINIHDVPNSKGKIMLAFYNKADGFMEKDKTFLNRIIPAQQGVVRCDLSDVKQGNYAIAVYHDSNENGKLDKNMLGIPTEYYGFSNDARGSFGPPSFKDCEISINGYKEINIHLR